MPAAKKKAARKATAKKPATPKSVQAPKAGKPGKTRIAVKTATPPKTPKSGKTPNGSFLAPPGAKSITLVVGAPAPSFTLPDASGAQVSLGQYAGDWLVLYFYPRDDTPGCTTEACEFTSMWDDFAALGAKVVGVSPDKGAAHQRFIEKYKLRVTLLSDPDKRMLTAYGAFGQKLMYGKPVLGVIRSTVIIDPKGRVAKHWPTVKAAGHAAAVAEALRALRTP